MIVKNILKKVFVFLVLSASFLTLNSQEAFATSATEQSELASKLVRNVKEVGNDRYYKGDFYSDVGTYPEGMFLVVENLIENYIAFAHMGEASYLAPIGQKFEEKIDGQVVKRYIAVSQKKKQGYYCIDIYDDLKIQYKGKTYKNQKALEFLGF